jgi:beta-glucanase (GH16 family)
MKLLLLSCVFLLTELSTFGSSQLKTRNWRLIWADSFSKEGNPDTTRWSYISSKGGGCYRYMTNSNKDTYIKDGKLILRAAVNTNPKDTVVYTTGGVLSKGKFSFHQGKIEVRAKLGAGKGSWPAIWLLPEKDQPLYGEIDIMEHLNHDTIFYQTIHTHYTLKLGFKDNPPHFATAKFKVGEFNIFGLEWYADRLDLTINGKVTFSYPKIETDKPGQWTFDKPFYIILNQALGGWAGTIDPKELPLQMEVDWVKVYQLKD